MKLQPDGDSSRRNDAILAEQRNELVLSAVGVVDSVIAEIVPKLPPFVDRGELRSAGLLGLVEASRRFDPALGVPFERYARFRVRGAVLDSTRAGVMNDRKHRQLARRAEVASAELAASLGRKASLAEVAEALSEDPEQVRESVHRAATGHVTQLGAYPVGEESEEIQIELAISGQSPEVPEDHVEALEARRLLGLALGALDEPHRSVVERYFLREEKLLSIAASLGVTKGRASQIRAEAVAALRDYFATQYDEVAPSDPAEPGARMRKAFLERLLKTAAAAESHR